MRGDPTWHPEVNVPGRILTLRLLFFFVVSLSVVNVVDGQARMLFPPGRSSRWRMENDWLENFDDHLVNCGGLELEKYEVDYQCGVCGDNITSNFTFPHQAGGMYSARTVSAEFNVSDEFVAEVEILAARFGYLEFHICPSNNFSVAATHECMNAHPVQPLNGSIRGFKWYVPNNPDIAHGYHHILLKLPEGLECAQCVLRMRWRTGTNWGEEGFLSGLGYGRQEYFFACSDIQIGEGFNDTQLAAPNRGAGGGSIYLPNTQPVRPFQRVATDRKTNSFIQPTRRPSRPFINKGTTAEPGVTNPPVGDSRTTIRSRGSSQTGYSAGSTSSATARTTPQTRGSETSVPSLASTNPSNFNGLTTLSPLLPSNKMPVTALPVGPTLPSHLSLTSALIQILTTVRPTVVGGRPTDAGGYVVSTDVNGQKGGSVPTTSTQGISSRSFESATDGILSRIVATTLQAGDIHTEQTIRGRVIRVQPTAAGGRTTDFEGHVVSTDAGREESGSVTTTPEKGISTRSSESAVGGILSSKASTSTKSNTPSLTEPPINLSTIDSGVSLSTAANIGPTASPETAPSTVKNTQSTRTADTTKDDTATGTVGQKYVTDRPNSRGGGSVQSTIFSQTVTTSETDTLSGSITPARLIVRTTHLTGYSIMTDGGLRISTTPSAGMVIKTDAVVPDSKTNTTKPLGILVSNSPSIVSNFAGLVAHTTVSVREATSHTAVSQDANISGNTDGSTSGNMATESNTTMKITPAQMIGSQETTSSPLTTNENMATESIMVEVLNGSTTRMTGSPRVTDMSLPTTTEQTRREETTAQSATALETQSPKKVPDSATSTTHEPDRVHIIDASSMPSVTAETTTQAQGLIDGVVSASTAHLATSTAINRAEVNPSTYVTKHTAVTDPTPTAVDGGVLLDETTAHHSKSSVEIGATVNPGDTGKISTSKVGGQASPTTTKPGQSATSAIPGNVGQTFDQKFTTVSARSNSNIQNTSTKASTTGPYVPTTTMKYASALVTSTPLSGVVENSTTKPDPTSELPIEYTFTTDSPTTSITSDSSVETGHTMTIASANSNSPSLTTLLVRGTSRAQGLTSTGEVTYPNNSTEYATRYEENGSTTTRSSQTSEQVTQITSPEYSTLDPSGNPQTTANHGGGKRPGTDSSQKQSGPMVATPATTIRTVRTNTDGSTVGNQITPKETYSVRTVAGNDVYTNATSGVHAIGTRTPNYEITTTGAYEVRTVPGRVIEINGSVVVNGRDDNLKTTKGTSSQSTGLVGTTVVYQATTLPTYNTTFGEVVTSVRSVVPPFVENSRTPPNVTPSQGAIVHPSTTAPSTPPTPGAVTTVTIDGPIPSKGNSITANPIETTQTTSSVNVNTQTSPETQIRTHIGGERGTTPSETRSSTPIGDGVTSIPSASPSSKSGSNADQQTNETLSNGDAKITNAYSPPLVGNSVTPSTSTNANPGSVISQSTTLSQGNGVATSTKASLSLSESNSAKLLSSTIVIPRGITGQPITVTLKTPGTPANKVGTPMNISSPASVGNSVTPTSGTNAESVTNQSKTASFKMTTIQGNQVPTSMKTSPSPSVGVGISVTPIAGTNLRSKGITDHTTSTTSTDAIKIKSSAGLTPVSGPGVSSERGINTSQMITATPTSSRAASPSTDNPGSVRETEVGSESGYSTGQPTTATLMPIRNVLPSTMNPRTPILGVDQSPKGGSITDQPLPVIHTTTTTTATSSTEIVTTVAGASYTPIDISVTPIVVITTVSGNAATTNLSATVSPTTAHVSSSKVTTPVIAHSSAPEVTVLPGATAHISAKSTPINVTTKIPVTTGYVDGIITSVREASPSAVVDGSASTVINNTSSTRTSTPSNSQAAVDVGVTPDPKRTPPDGSDQNYTSAGYVTTTYSSANYSSGSSKSEYEISRQFANRSSTISRAAKSSTTIGIIRNTTPEPQSSARVPEQPVDTGGNTKPNVGSLTPKITSVTGGGNALLTTTRKAVQTTKPQKLGYPPAPDVTFVQALSMCDAMHPHYAITGSKNWCLLNCARGFCPQFFCNNFCLALLNTFAPWAQ